MDEYEDIIGLPHHVSTRHPHMPMRQRAAQFAAFAALTGYDDAIRDAAQIGVDLHEEELREDDGYYGDRGAAEWEVNDD